MFFKAGDGRKGREQTKNKVELEQWPNKCKFSATINNVTEIGR